MFEIVVIICCTILLILVKIFLNIKFKDIKELKNRETEKLEELSNRFPDNEKICKYILNKFDNKDVKIKTDEEYSSCLYTIFNNTIIIGKFKQNYMKLQTIAHECIHSIQNKRTLWANFIVTNIYLIYFVVILILELLNNLPNANSHILILIFLSFIQYIFRNSLETDAMSRAKHIAEEYIEETKILNKNETEKLLNEYEEVNKIGIPFMNFYLLCSNLTKVIIFSIIVLILR